jgi:hypothetical protein
MTGMAHMAALMLAERRARREKIGPRPGNSVVGRTDGGSRVALFSFFYFISLICFFSFLFLEFRFEFKFGYGIHP